MEGEPKAGRRSWPYLRERGDRRGRALDRDDGHRAQGRLRHRRGPRRRIGARDPAALRRGHGIGAHGPGAAPLLHSGGIHPARARCVRSPPTWSTSAARTRAARRRRCSHADSSRRRAGDAPPGLPRAPPLARGDERVRPWPCRRANRGLRVGRRLPLGRGLGSTVVLNGVSTQPHRADARAALEVPATATPVVGGIGRLHEQKGWDVLCRAAGTVRRDFPDAHFVIIGEGPERERLEAEPECSKVQFAGAMENAAGLIDAFDSSSSPRAGRASGGSRWRRCSPAYPYRLRRRGTPRGGGRRRVLADVDDPMASPRRSGGWSGAPTCDRSRRARRRRAEKPFDNERMVKEVGAVYGTVLWSRAGS